MRGGVIPAVSLAHRLGIRDVRTVGITRTASDSIDAAMTTLPGVRNAASLGVLTGLDVLLVDDTAGSGAPLAHTADVIRARDPRPAAQGHPHRSALRSSHRCRAPTRPRPVEPVPNRYAGPMGKQCPIRHKCFEVP
ncbi:hypothetical protein [Streptomyces sp. NRRL S-1448]|uniref:hypothetical protein n=1 Tax=Streptomyces sp. NRRL S-1448 TaxID=1463883 RepID=UPI00099C7854